MSAELSLLTFHSRALEEDDLLVTGFSGTEELGQPYRFEIDLVGHKVDIDLRSMLRIPAALGIKQGIQLASGGRGMVTRKIHGRVYSVEQLGAVNDMTRYRVILVPELWKLTLTHQSRIFLECSVVGLIERVLKAGGIGADQYELRLARSYETREYVVQYEESDLDFLSRWLEHEGIYYFFEQTDDGERVVFADSSAAYSEIGEDMSVPFRPEVGANDGRSEVGDADSQDWFKEEVLQTVRSRIATVPASVTLNDYDWKRPTEQLRVTLDVLAEGEGMIYEYNNHYKDPEREGKDLAQVRVEELLQQEHVVSGTGDCRSFRPGARFRLVDHPRPDLNATFVLTRVEQQGTQAVGLAGVTSASYRNSFVAIPAEREFRPARRTAWPSIKGVMHAHVDGPKNSKTAQIDALGRYKVKLPLDLADSTEGKSSRFVRMAQPYAGAKYGMHFPLHVGTEVLLTHIDGDPDRPVIIGSVPNMDTASPVDSSTPDRNVLKTASGVMLEFKDAHS